MQPPTTSEERDRRENLSNKIGVVNDIMSLLTDVEDTVAKLKILKALLSGVITDEEVINILQEVIEKLEAGGELENDFDDSNADSIDSEPMDFGADSEPSFNGGNSVGEEEETNVEETATGGEESLPSPEELGIDMTDSNNPDFD